VGGRGGRKEWGGNGEYASLALGGWTPLICTALCKQL